MFGLLDVSLVKCSMEKYYSRAAIISTNCLRYSTFLGPLKILLSLNFVVLEFSSTCALGQNVIKQILPPFFHVATNQVLNVNKGLELLESLLAFDPKDRLTAEAGLAHPYLAMYHVPDDEPSHPKPLDFAFELTNTIPEIKSNLFV